MMSIASVYMPKSCMRSSKVSLFYQWIIQIKWMANIITCTEAADEYERHRHPHKMETKVTRSPNFNCIHYIFKGIIILFMFIRLLVEIWQLLPSLWYCVQVYWHGGCMRGEWFK